MRGGGGVGLVWFRGHKFCGKRQTHLVPSKADQGEGCSLNHAQLLRHFRNLAGIDHNVLAQASVLPGLGHPVHSVPFLETFRLPPHRDYYPGKIEPGCVQGVHACT